MVRKLSALALVLVVAGAALLATGPGRRAVLGERDEVSEASFCETLDEVDVGAALGGDDPTARVTAVAALAAVGDRAPAEIREPMRTIQAYAEDQPAIAAAATMEEADPDAFGAAFQAVYALRFEPEFRAASALVERFGFERCGIQLSGHFDLEVDAGLDPSLLPGLDIGEVEDPVFEFDRSDFEPYQVAPIEDPHYEFDRSGYDQYRLRLEDGQ